MKLDKYALKAGEDQTVFEFISEGQQGAIRKIILFQPTPNPTSTTSHLVTVTY